MSIRSQVQVVWRICKRRRAPRDEATEGEVAPETSEASEVGVAGQPGERAAAAGGDVAAAGGDVATATGRSASWCAQAPSGPGRPPPFSRLREIIPRWCEIFSARRGWRSCTYLRGRQSGGELMMTIA